MKPEKYNLILRVLHWSMAVIIILLLISGLTVESWPKDIRQHFYFWHKSFGMLILFLLFVRVAFKILTPEPELPKELNKFTIFAARAGWAMLYVFMLVLPLSGYIASDAGGYPVPFFGLTIPDIIETNKPLGKTVWYFHEVLPWFFVAVIFLHIFAALKHYMFDKINLFRRMW